MLLELEPPYLVIKPGVSEAEFYALEGEDSDWEYLDGRLVMSPASDRHEDLFGFLSSLLRLFLDERGGGVVRGSRTPMRLDERWSPEPDLLVVGSARAHRLTPKYLDGPADLVIEIVSEADPRFEVREKLPRYQQAGIPEIWLIDPANRQLSVHWLEGAAYHQATATTGRLEARTVPGFWIEVDWLWQEKLPSTFDCLRRVLG
ncbi:MAG TPA: Uma2 family endonuclease [Thermoanaerobaculia bacterium]|nr:Uma2 family endonuclease [Thermoanaerobaculia bacterium]